MHLLSPPFLYAHGPASPRVRCCTAESGQKAKTALDAAHEEALVLMKDAEELLGKGEMQEAQAHFQFALEK